MTGALRRRRSQGNFSANNMEYYCQYNRKRRYVLTKQNFFSSISNSLQIIRLNKAVLSKKHATATSNADVDTALIPDDALVRIIFE